MIANSTAAFVAVLSVVVGALLGFGAGRRLLFRNNLGEALVVDTIVMGLRRPHVLLNNVTLQAESGTTQIDHVLVADTGVFVIETKHYSGWIFGDPNHSHWTQVIYRTRWQFQNPLRQNYGHLKAIQSIFNLPDEAFFPLVVFSGGAEFKTDLGPTVLRLHQLLPISQAVALSSSMNAKWRI